MDEETQRKKKQEECHRLYSQLVTIVEDVQAFVSEEGVQNSPGREKPLDKLLQQRGVYNWYVPFNRKPPQSFMTLFKIDPEEFSKKMLNDHPTLADDLLQGRIVRIYAEEVAVKE